MEADRRIDKRYVISFITVLAIGFIAHGYAMNNLISSRDASGIINGIGNTYDSGRWGLWMLELITKKLWGGIYSLPFFNIFLSMVFIALSIMVMIRMFDLKHTATIALISGLMVSYPVLSSSILYVYTVPYYMFAVLLSFISAWMMASDSIFKKIIAVALSVFSLAIYQAYLPLTASMVLIYLFCRCFEGADPMELLKKGIAAAVSIFISAVLYIVIARMVCEMHGISLNAYKGIDTMGEINLYELLKRIGRTYWYTIGFPFRTFHLININLLSKICIFIAYAITAIIVLAHFFRMKNIWNRMFVLLLAAVMPLCVNMIYIMVPEKNSVNTMMVYSSICMLLMPLIMTDKFLGGGTKASLPGGIHIKSFGKIIMLSSLCLIMEFCWYANGIYTANTYALKQTDAYFTTLITQIKSVEGYTADTPVILIGDMVSNDFSCGEGLENFATPGNPIDNPIGSSWALKNYLKNHLGFDPVYVSISDMSEEDQHVIEDMPSYPETESIRMISGVCVVKGRE